jgi:hypothetical protein
MKRMQTIRERIGHDLRGATGRYTGFKQAAEEVDDEIERADFSARAKRHFADAREIEGQFMLVTALGIK